MISLIKDLTALSHLMSTQNLPPESFVVWPVWHTLNKSKKDPNFLKKGEVKLTVKQNTHFLLLAQIYCAFL